MGISLTLDEDLVAWIDSQAAKSGLNRSQYVEMGMRLARDVHPEIVQSFQSLSALSEKLPKLLKVMQEELSALEVKSKK